MTDSSPEPDLPHHSATPVQTGGRRDALLMAGLELFGRHGLDATSTRALAEKAGANVAAIPYYFGSKEGLYLAVADYIGRRMHELFVDLIDAFEGAFAENRVDAAFAIDAMHRLVDRMVDLILVGEEPKSWVSFIGRVHAHPGEAFNVFYQRIKRHQEIATQLIAVAAKLPVTGRECRVREHVFFSQVLGFLTCRERLLRNLALDSLDADTMTDIRQTVHYFLDACLTLP